MDKLVLAYEVAKKFHAGQKDRAGKDYIYHVKFVSDQVLPLGEEYALVGMLHDTLEDTAMDRGTLEQLFGKTVADAVALLMEVEEALNRDWDTLIKWREVAREMIGRMLTDQNRIVLMTRIVNHRSWKRVAGVLNKSEDYVRHLYPVAVAEFESRVAEEYPGYLDTVDIPG